MLRKIIVALTTLVAVAAPVALVATPAEAANTPCMSRTEYNRVRVGMPASTVFAIVGGKGRVSMASSYLTIRQWKNCANAYGVGTIGFVNGRVQSKSLF